MTKEYIGNDQENENFIYDFYYLDDTATSHQMDQYRTVRIESFPECLVLENEYDENDTADHDSEDSNDEANPANDYPEEPSQSTSSDEEAERRLRMRSLYDSSDEEFSISRRDYHDNLFSDDEDEDEDEDDSENQLDRNRRRFGKFADYLQTTHHRKNDSSEDEHDEDDENTEDEHDDDDDDEMS